LTSNNVTLIINIEVAKRYFTGGEYIEKLVTKIKKSKRDDA